MLTNYKIEYAVTFHGHEQPGERLTDDPVTCEEVLSELLERRFKIRRILHDGISLEGAEFDRLIRIAGMLATRAICESLEMDSSEARRRFGSPA